MVKLNMHVFTALQLNDRLAIDKRVAIDDRVNFLGKPTAWSLAWSLGATILVGLGAVKAWGFAPVARIDYLTGPYKTVFP
jgi:hypothetical protein